MTAQRDKLESVLAEIDAILGESGPRLPWVMSNDVQQQRQMLAKARALLAELKQADALSSDQPQPTEQDTTPAPSGPPDIDPTAQASSQVLKALLQEMQYLRGQTMQILDPLRNEVASLKQQRELLLNEVQQLQQQRLQLDQETPPGSLTGPWEEMLQQLTHYLETHFNQQLQQSVKRLETTAANTYLLTQNNEGDAVGDSPLTPAQRLEYLKQIQSQSDRLVMNLDRVLRTVFDSLQQSIYSYQDSLGHGLSKMHTLGQQGEMMFNALISHLAQQMNQDALAYLESNQAPSFQSQQLPDAATRRTPDSVSEKDEPDASSATPSEAGANLELGDLDLDLALNDDEVTLLQLDDEISQLQVDVDPLADEYDPTRGEEFLLERVQESPPAPKAEGMTGEVFDPLEVLNQLDEAAPSPSPSVSLPDGPQPDTVEASFKTDLPGEEDAENALDDLYQSLFGDVLRPDQPSIPASEHPEENPESGRADQLSQELTSHASDTATTSDEATLEDEATLSAATDSPISEAAAPNNLASLLEPVEAESVEPDEEVVYEENQASLDQLFGDGTAQQLTEAARQASDDEADTITALDDLLPESQSTFGEPLAGLRGETENTSSDESDISLSPGDVDFVPASPDEDLLVGDNLTQGNDYVLEVNQDIVDQLNEDLLGLEAGEMPEPPDLAEHSSDSLENQVGTRDEAPRGSEQPADTIENSFASFGEGPISAPEAIEGTSLPGVETSTPAESVDSLETTAEDNFSDTTALPQPSEAPADSLTPVEQEDLPPLPANDTLEAAFGDFADASELSTASPESAPPGSSASVPFSAPESDDLWQEAQPTVEDNPMSTGDLPSQETIEALLSDLSLDPEPDQPAVGESGLTLDALESLAKPPETQGSDQPARSGAVPEPPPSQPGRQPITPEPVESSSATEGSVEPYDSSLTLENLVGELKLDPLFPDDGGEGSLPPITADNVFPGSPDPSPSASANQGRRPESAAPSPTSSEPTDPPRTPEPEGIDVFPQGVEGPSPGVDAPNQDGLELFENIPSDESVAAEAKDSGIDLFGEKLSVEPTPEAPEPQGIDLFGEASPAEPAPTEQEDDGIDLFGAVSAVEPVFESSEEEGIHLFGETPPPDPTPRSGEAPSATPSGDGIDLFGDDASPPITLDDLDLTLGDDRAEQELPSAESALSNELGEPEDQGIDLFGDMPSVEPSSTAPDTEAFNAEDRSTGQPSSEDSSEDQGIDLFGDTSADQTSADTAEESEVSSEDQGIDLFGDTSADQTSADTPEENAQGISADATTAGDDETAVKYTEWLNDISLDTILGTTAGPSDPAAEEDVPQEPSAASASMPALDLPGAKDSETTSISDPVQEPGHGETTPSEDLEEAQGTSTDISSLEDLVEETLVTEDQETASGFDLPDPGPSTLGDWGPAGQVSEQEFINLDALLDDSFASEAGQSHGAESLNLEEGSPSTQDFDREIDFIDLDSLLGEPPSTAGDEPRVADFGAFLEPTTESAETFPIHDLSSPQEDEETPAQEGPFDQDDVTDQTAFESPSADDSWEETLSDLPSADIFTEETLVDLPTPEDFPQPASPEDFVTETEPEGALETSSPEDGLTADPAIPEAAPAAEESMTPENREEGMTSEGFDEGDSENFADTGAGTEQRITADESPDWSLTTAAPQFPVADLPAQGDELFESAFAENKTLEPEAAEPPMDASMARESQGLWFLGLDIGAQGISAVLLQRQTGQVFPLYWVDTTISGATADKFFRLPTFASVGPTEQGYSLQSVGSSALMVNWDEAEFADSEEETILVKSLKSFLKMGLPIQATDTAEPQPMIQWSDQVQFPLHTFAAALEELLRTLLQSAVTRSTLAVGAIGLETEDITAALQDLRGVVVSYPANWPDTYPFNVREAVVNAGLVDRPDDVYFLEDAIAAVLSGLPDPSEPPPAANGQPIQQQTLYACHWSGGTAVISAGATVTEIGLANLPQDLERLSYHDFALHSMGYAGDAIDLDIICHLLHPSERRQPRNPDRYRSPSTTDGWSWQAAMPELDAAHWDDLDLDSLDFPRIAEPDLPRRYRLQQRLESTLLGQSVLEAVRHLKIILQHQPQFELELADQRWVVRSKDLEDRIILPYIQRINGHLNKLLSEVGLTTQGINQVICTGGSASLPKISRWLRQKFPNATIIQDTYHSDRPPSCSRVAYGLVNLIRYPQVFDLTRHQYSDMFLLMELLRTFPDQPMPLSGILHLLKERGINTEACELHLIALLEGRLPPGLLPATSNPYVNVAAEEDPGLQALLTMPLFTRPNHQVYVPNPDQCQRLRAYMETILAVKQQTLRDPLLADLMSIAV